MSTAASSRLDAGFTPSKAVTTSTQYKISPSAPQSVRAFVASAIGPVVALLTLYAIYLLRGFPIGRPEVVLAILVVLLGYPGASRFMGATMSVFADILSDWVVICGMLLLSGYLTDSFGLFHLKTLLVWAIATPFLQFAAVRVGRKVLLARAQSSDSRRRALIVGGSALGVRLANALAAHAVEGIDLVGYVDDRDGDRCHKDAASRIVGGFDDLPELIQRHQVRDVYIVLPLSMQPRIANLLAALQDSAVSIHYVPDVFGVNIIQGRVDSLDGMPVVSLLDSPFQGVNGLVKRVTDFVLATVILLLISPVMLAIAVGVKISSPGPVIFKQRRHGLDGEEITVYKFRSMTTMDNGPVVQQATKNDPRITPFGAFLRRSSLDELPQFLNVLQGRMSIVGPRPHAVAHNEHYRKIIRAYMVRHKVRPGITGWAQVNGLRGETDTTEKMAQRVDYDLEYLRNWSLALDLKIIARTAGLTFFDRNAY